jgi:hypothetical protein
MNEGDRYQEWFTAKNEEWEAKCTRCGACCGSLEDPCENLRKDKTNKYYCAVYDKRFGLWHTISGKEINCVPIREKLTKGHSWPGDEHCGYKKVC